MSSGRTFLNTPRGALPTGVRVAATMYASCTCFAMLKSPIQISPQRRKGREGNPTTVIVFDDGAFDPIPAENAGPRSPNQNC
jgi:hypothetical protein